MIDKERLGGKVMPKINVLQLIEGFNLGGAEKKLLELVDHIDRERFNTVICSLGMGQSLKNEFQKLGFKVVVLPRKWRLDFSLLFKLVKLIKEEKIDVVMTTLFYADVVGALAAKLAGAKAVFSWETISAPEWLLKRRLLAYRLAIKYCDKVISVSKATKRFLIDKRGVKPEKVMTILYGVDIDLFRESDGSAKRKELGIDVLTPVIGVVGRLHPQKGHIYLIEAANPIIRKYPKVKFLLVGDGPSREELETEVKQRGLNSAFIFLGFRKDVKDLLNTLDIFVLPSLYEGLPNVVLEAMACNKPVVATAVDGTSEAVVTGITGYLVPPKDPGCLSKAILKLLANKEKARSMGIMGGKRVEQYFSLEGQVKKFEKLYQFKNKTVAK